MTDQSNIVQVTLPAPKKIMEWNAEQQQAIHFGDFRRSFCLIGAAGTGKTSTLTELVRVMEENHRFPMLEVSTDNLLTGRSGIVFLSYTNRAVRNMRRMLPANLKSHAMTYHKLLEYGPEMHEEYVDGELVKKMRFVPGRNRDNTLPRNLTTIVVDEASMPSIDLHNELLDALPYAGAVQFIFLGDLNQLPPVYGDAILGKALLELPIVELTRVYRQALESPIVSLAHAIKSNDFTVFNASCRDGTFGITTKKGGAFKSAASITEETVIERPGRGKVTLTPWLQKLDMDSGLAAVKQKLRAMMRSGQYDPEQDLVLCPWNKAFGNDELNKSVADYLGQQRGAEVVEIIAGFEKVYYAVGDRIVANKQEARIKRITRNPRYMGKSTCKPSKTLNRWGHDSGGRQEDLDASEFDVDAILDAAASDVTDRVNQCSHIIDIVYDDVGEDIPVSLRTSGEINNTYFAYCISVHKAQGSECRRVIVITHACHSKMLSRELVYTAITRAAEELHILMTPHMLETSAARPRIKGDTLAAKLEFFQNRLNERSE